MSRNNTLSNQELINASRKWIKRLIEKGCVPLPVPANPNKDYDLIFSELIDRFEQMDRDNRTGTNLSLRRL